MADAPKERAPTTPAEEARRRRVGGLAHVAASLVLALAVVLMLNYLSFRHYERWDWTEEGIYTLSERTEEELRALSEPVDVYVFLSQGEANYPEVEELLDRYGAVTGQVRTHFVDPDRNPSEFRVLAQRFGISTAMIEGGGTLADVAAVVTRGERKWTITRDDLRSLDFGSLDSDDPKIDVNAEQAFTGAIVQVTSGEPTKVCASTGHGEWSIEGGSERSLYALQDELRRDNVEMESVETFGTRPVPDDCDALFVIGPLRSFGEDEARQLLAYLDRGGNVLFALDPVLEHDRIEPTGLEGLLEELGVHVDSSIVLETDLERLLPPGNPMGPFLVTSYGDHRTVEALAQTRGRAVLALARSVRPVDGSGATVLLQTSERGWAETDVSELAADQEPEAGPDDVRGPVSLAVATARRSGGAPAEDEGGEEPRGGRVVVVGDAEWLMAEALRDPRYTNFDLAFAWTGWLTERETLISLQPKQVSARPMSISDGDLGSLAFRLIVLMPAAMLLLGFAMWWSRRS